MKQMRYYIIWWSISVAVTLVNSDIETQIAVQLLPKVEAAPLSQQYNNSSTSDISARELFRQAYENRYTWDLDFPGYTAMVEFTQEKKNYKGQVRINPDLNVEVTGIENENARQTVENQLRMFVVHRRRVLFEEAHKNNTFKLNATDKSGALEIIQQGKTEARYKILDQQIMQVNRTLGQHPVTVDTLDTMVTAEGYIPTKYRTTFYQPQTKQILGEELSEDAYEKIGKYYLPIFQVVQHSEAGESFAVKLKFTNIKLLSDKSV